MLGTPHEKFRRLRFPVSFALLQELFVTGNELPKTLVEKGLPKDARIINAYISGADSDLHDCVIFVVESAEFPEIEQGCALPLGDIYFRRIAD